LSRVHIPLRSVHPGPRHATQVLLLLLLLL
jgi:hypothetical protein